MTLKLVKVIQHWNVNCVLAKDFETKPTKYKIPNCENDTTLKWLQIIVLYSFIFFALFFINKKPETLHLAI